MLRSGVRWDGLARVDLGARDQVAYRVADHMRRGQLGFFADDRGELPGTVVGARFEEAAASRCRGRILQIRQLKTREPSAILFGRAREEPAGTAPEHVLLADRAGVVVGLGDVSWVPDRAHGTDARAESTDGEPWVGFIADFKATEKYFAYAVLDHGRTLCKVGETADQHSR